MDEPIIATPAGSLTVPNTATKQEHHDAMGAVLTEAIREGKRSVPDDPAPLVCKPQEIESWRVFKIMSEFVDGFDVIRKYGLAATFFGSARTAPPPTPSIWRRPSSLAAWPRLAMPLSREPPQASWKRPIRARTRPGGASIGLNIRLNDTQGDNRYLTEHMTFEHFFVRKVMLAFASEVYIYFPGGFGTLDEFTEILTLVQTKKIRPVPIVVYGREYWEPLIAFFKTTLLAEHQSIDEADLDLFKVVDSVDEAYDYIIATVRC